jgi:hypothetical protein
MGGLRVLCKMSQLQYPRRCVPGPSYCPILGGTGMGGGSSGDHGMGTDVEGTERTTWLEQLVDRGILYAVNIYCLIFYEV